MQEPYGSTKSRVVAVFGPLRPLYDAWMRCIAGVSWVIVRVLLVVVFVTVFLAYGIALRIAGKDPMNRALEDDRDTYWEDAAVNNDDIEDFRRQY